jgi:hypothetical protein
MLMDWSDGAELMNYSMKKNICRTHKLQSGLLSNCELKKLLTCVILFFIAIIPLLSTSLLLAQELPYPNPLLPKNGAKDVEVTSVFFSWTPFYAGTEEYTFELSTKFDMSSDVFQVITKNRVTTYTYKGTMKYNTTYWWRVMATKPLGGEWSPVSNFTTKAEAASGGNNPSQSDTSSNSASGSFIASLADIGWPLIVGIAAGIIILIVVLFILLRPNPKYAGSPGSQPGAQSFVRGQQPSTQPFAQGPQPVVCRNCGLSNNPSSQFCNSCGTPLPSPSQQQMGGGQQASPCPRCNFINPPQQQFCANCGNSLTNMRQQSPDPGQPNICPACGLPNASNQKFCNRCGGSITGGTQQKPWQVYQTYSCPFCGSQVSKQTNPCPNCGNWLNWST